MKDIVLNNPIVGMYIHDVGGISITGNQKSVWKGKESSLYLPLLNLFVMHSNADIKFTTGENISDDINTHDERATTKRFSPSVMNKSKLNVTQNSLILGPVHIALNFTKYNLTLTSDKSLPMLYRPLVNSSMSEYQGKLIIFTIDNIVTPSEYKSVYGVSNYLEVLKEKYRNNTAPGYKRLVDLIVQIQGYWLLTGNTSDATPSSTIKICRCMQLSEEALLEKESFQDLYLRQESLVISGKSVTEVEDHPNLASVGMADQQLVDVIRPHGVSCYIVDPDDAIGERYYTVAGMVKQVPKIRSNDAAPGLYIVSTDSSVRIGNDSFTPLSEIDQNKCIFKSREEAEKGADVKTLFSYEAELNKIGRTEEAEQIRMATLRAKHESDERLNKLERQLAEDRARHERELLEAKRLHEQEMASIKVDHRRMDMDHDRTKYHYDARSLHNKSAYEEDRYARDSTIETLKTAGSLAGLAVAGLLAYRKFS